MEQHTDGRERGQGLYSLRGRGKNLCPAPQERCRDSILGSRRCTATGPVLIFQCTTFFECTFQGPSILPSTTEHRSARTPRSKDARLYKNASVMALEVYLKLMPGSRNRSGSLFAIGTLSGSGSVVLAPKISLMPYRRHTLTNGVC